MSNWKVGPGGRLYHPTTGAYVGQLDLNGNEQMVLGITTTSDQGGGFPTAGGKMLNGPNLYSRPEIHRCTDANYSTVDNSVLLQTFTVAMSLTEQFDAIQIGYPHLGSTVGTRGIVGLKALIAGTDDAGDGSLSAATASGRKFVTPWRGGVENNSVTAQGWRAVTWGGAASVDIPDAGDKNISIAWSDMIPCGGIEDKNRAGSYPLLVRLYPGAGYYTKCERAGLSSPAKAYADSGIASILYARKSGGDVVTTPADWSNATTTIAISDIGIPLIIRGYSRRRVRSIMTIGDSRFANVHEDYANFGYRSCSFLIEKALRESGINALRVECCMSAQTTSTYQTRALQYLEKIHPDVAVYLVCSINDGQPTPDLIAPMRARTLEFLDACARIGTMPILVSAFPSVNSGSTVGASGVAALNDIDSWTRSLGFPSISPIQLYGDLTTGAWQSGWNYDVYHMNNAGYLDLSARIAALAAQYLL